jgi:hypothetical protein
MAYYQAKPVLPKLWGILKTIQQALHFSKCPASFFSFFPQYHRKNVKRKSASALGRVLPLEHGIGEISS